MEEGDDNFNKNANNERKLQINEKNSIISRCFSHYSFCQRISEEFEENFNWKDKGVEGNGGKLCSTNCECCKVSPCCGSPPSLLSSLYCWICWTGGCICVNGKLIAYSHDENCKIINHSSAFLFVLSIGIIWMSFYLILARTIIPIPFLGFLGFLIAFWIYSAIIRWNVRRKLKIGGKSIFTLFIDLIFTCCLFTYFCNLCQLARSLPREEWDVCSDIRERKIGCCDGDTLGLVFRNDFDDV